MALTIALRRNSHFSLRPLGAFLSLVSASAALREACERSGTPQHLLEGALEQVRLAEHHGASAPEFEVKCVRVYVPPPLADATSRPMLLFRGTPDASIEERLPAGRRRPLFFSSSLRVALPFGRIDGARGKHRVALCRVERRPGHQLFNRVVATEEDLRLFDSVGGDLDRFSLAKTKQSATNGRGDEGAFDGVVEWLDGGASYRFDAAHARIHTLLCIDVQW
ncbi:hypothetical protein TcBrA4_0122820 [Trypanosoma cruzi]|nr:hypothetical protein TcBrA4_0122730 [Trypanosoma cruzi]KAF8276955.1 hypothetical protein TcBrA4_0122820 [Trypanosoma cruzi]